MCGQVKHASHLLNMKTKWPNIHHHHLDPRVVWLVGCPFSWVQHYCASITHHSVNQWIKESRHQGMNQLNNQTIDSSINQLTDQQIRRSAQSIDRSINRSIIWSINRSINRSINWSIHRSTNQIKLSNEWLSELATVWVFEWVSERVGE